jgi:PHS family inorganic phosphate transporter-like MFS transporter
LEQTLLMAETPVAEPGTFDALDDGKITRFQYKIMFISGMGFFTDAYDLFIIGIVVDLLKTQWSLSTGQVSLLNSATLAASALGAVVFGRVADILGRKKIYGYEVLILAVGAIASALSPNYTFLLVSRIILGIGIGGDYPVSATIMSEYSGKRSRGRMVGLVFAMQGAGLVVGPLLAAILLATHVPEGDIWRILLGLGAIPGLAVFYLRRQINETPRFAQAGGDLGEAQAAIAAATGQSASRGPRPESKARHQQTALEGFKALVGNRRMLFWLIGTAGAWAMLDFAYYGNTISSPEVLKVIDPTGSLLHNTLLQLLIFSVFALPGYALAIRLLDKTGRKKIQCFGFTMMAVAFLLIGLVPGATTTVAPFVILFGASYFFTEFGPNMTTFVYPAEIFPVNVRTTAHGISAATGKLGAFAGAYLFPDMLASHFGLRGAEVVAGVVCILGLGLSSWLLPEPKALSLEQLEQAAYAPQTRANLKPATS